MKRVLSTVMCSLFLLTTACGGNGEESGGEGNGQATEPGDTSENLVPIETTEFRFEMPDTVTGGVVTLAAKNSGGLPHELAFGRIDGDHDLADVMKAIEEQKEPPWFTDIAGIPALSPGLSSSMIRELDEGRYIFMCFLPTADGQPHVTEGMVKIFDVEGTSDAELPTPDVTITVTENGFDISGSVTAGEQLIELVNDGEREHEFQITAFEPGKTEKDIEKWFRSGYKEEAPVIFPGGMQSIKPGTSLVVEMTFEAGRTYMLQDFIAGFKEEITIE